MRDLTKRRSGGEFTLDCFDRFISFLYHLIVLLVYIFTVTGSLSLLYSPDEKQRKLVREHFNSSVAAE